MKSNNRLYTDDHPESTIKNMGFANAEKARQTIDILENLDLHAPNRWKTKKKEEKRIYVQQVLVTMFYRAKHHPHRTKKMEEAMRVLQEYASKHKDLNIRLE